MSARRPRLRDISERAGVSKATVDRVVNNRAGVQDHTRRHVLSVIAELAGGVPSNEDTIRLDFVIPDSGNAFMRQLVDHLRRAAERRIGVDVTFHHLVGIEQDEVVSTLERLDDADRAVGLIALDHQKIREAVRGLCGRGIPVITIASDISNVPRAAYVGIDNRAAGRLAGYLTGRMVRNGAGKVALILGARAYHGHQEREIGFRSVLRERFSDLHIVAEREIHEDIDTAHRSTLAVLKQHADLDAIYCIGAGQPGVARALIETGRAASVLFIGHGLSADTRTFLIDGVMDVVIDEDAALMADRAIESLVAVSRGQAPPPATAIRIQAIFAENLPVEP